MWHTAAKGPEEKLRLCGGRRICLSTMALSCTVSHVRTLPSAVQALQFKFYIIRNMKEVEGLDLKQPGILESKAFYLRNLCSKQRVCCFLGYFSCGPDYCASQARDSPCP